MILGEITKYCIFVQESWNKVQSMVLCTFETSFFQMKCIKKFIVLLKTYYKNK